ncbi:twin-arginine translocase TatA/TatE family subunit [Chloroflexota bacterium]
MGFFGIGTWEVLLILVVALIIFGPGRLPEIARTLGKTVRTLKKASFDLTTAVTKEIEGEEKPASEPKETPSVKPMQPLPDVSDTNSEHREDNQSNNPEGA